LATRLLVQRFFIILGKAAAGSMLGAMPADAPFQMVVLLQLFAILKGPHQLFGQFGAIPGSISSRFPSPETPRTVEKPQWKRIFVNIRISVRN
jgi:hypothetical protein